MEDPTRKRKCVHKDGKEEWVAVWGIRRCNSATCGGFRRWNRDHNAAINIRNNLLQFLETGAWPHGAAASQQHTLLSVLVLLLGHLPQRGGKQLWHPPRASCIKG